MPPTKCFLTTSVNLTDHSKPSSQPFSPTGFSPVVAQGRTLLPSAWEDKIYPFQRARALPQNSLPDNPHGLPASHSPDFSSAGLKDFFSGQNHYRNDHNSFIRPCEARGWALYRHWFRYSSMQSVETSFLRWFTIKCTFEWILRGKIVNVNKYTQSKDTYAYIEIVWSSILVYISIVER